MKDISIFKIKLCHFVSSHISMRKFNLRTSLGLFISIVICFNSFSMHTAYSQSVAQVTEAKSKLGTMTPDEIDAAIKKYGMTREEADAKARAVGIDLESYLKRRSSDTTPAPQPKTEINIQVSPTQVNPNGNVGQPAVQTPTVQTPDVQNPVGPTPVVQTPVVQPPVVQTPEPPKPPKQAPPVMGPGEIPYFGYNLFKAGTSAFEPRTLIDDQYLIGENDVLSISLWGDFQSYNEYKVDREGRILVNTVGPISVSGYTLERARNVVLNALGKVYSGLKRSPPSMFMDIAVARIRPLRIFIMGEVANPGGYAVSPIGNVFNSLFSAGGPNLSGSLRELKVIRNNKIITKVDLYDYLIGSQKTNDVRINDNDIIFVPLRGRTVGIKGAVLRTAYFELLPGENLKQLIEFSGGIRSTFYLQRIQIDRVVPFEERKNGEPDRKVFDVDSKEILTTDKDYKLEDGDIITVFPILEEKKNYVIIDGAVWRPGTYQLEKISTLKDLVKAADGLLPEFYPEHAKIVRTSDDKQTEIFYVNIDLALKGDFANNMKLQPRDNIYIFSRYEMLAGHDTVTVEGIAKRPGKYPLHQNLTLYDIVCETVGLADTLFRKEIYLPRADLVRLNEDRYTTRIYPFNLWDLFVDRIGDTLLMPGDRIIIYPVTAMEFTERYVDVAGKVKSPGRYKLSENMTLFDLLIQAGGYTEDAWSVQAEVARLERTGLGKDSLSRITFAQLPDLFDANKINSEAIANFRASSIRLQHRDQVFIRPNPKYIFQQNVTLDGEVEHPGTYVLSKLNERLSDVIHRAGGVKNSGYSKGGKIIRGGTRLRINIYDAIDDPEGDNDIKLQPGDIISIPSAPFVVQVSGEVNNTGLFSFVDGKKLSFYIEQSGGKTDSADFALITYPTGMVEQAELHWWSKNPKIPDGSSIHLVKIKPESPEPITVGPKTTTFDFLKDVFAIAVSAVTVIVLASKL